MRDLEEILNLQPIYTEVYEMLSHRPGKHERVAEKEADHKFQRRDSACDAWLREKERVMQHLEVLSVDSAALVQRMGRARVSVCSHTCINLFLKTTVEPAFRQQARDTHGTVACQMMSLR